MIFSDILGHKSAEVSKLASRDMHADTVCRKKFVRGEMP